MWEASMDDTQPGNEIAQAVNEAVDQARADASDDADLTREQLKIENQRIKSEERIAERLAERDEHVAELQVGAGRPAWVDDFLGELRNIFSSGAPQTEIHVEHDESPIPASAEDIPPEPEADKEVEEPVESVEELGGEDTAEVKDIPEETPGSDNDKPKGRFRRRSRRR